MNKKSIIATLLALVMSLACLTGCGQSTTSNESGQSLAKGGVLVLSVNPEIAVEYDENGLVTGVSARNDDAMDIISSCKGLIDKETREAVTDLVSAIGEAGYFVEEIEGERRQITIEIEAGSKLPHDAFLDEVVSDVRDCVNANNWNVPTDVENESDYGITDYVDTDYGPENDGVTDYDDGQSKYDDGNSDYNTPVVVVTPASSGNSDYNDGNSNYDDGQSDYNDGQSNYDDGTSDYETPVVNTPPATSGNSDYDDGQSNYDDGNSNYDDGNSDYDDGSDYGNSDYDD